MERGLNPGLSLRRRLARIAAWAAAPAVARYIRIQHGRLWSGAPPLPAAFAQRFAPYFDESLLAGVRIAGSASLSLPRVPYARVLGRLGFYIPGAETIAGITFGPLIAVRESEVSERLLFHELVHVVQYRLLGTADFARRYVEGFLVSGRYEEIPLEICAAVLEDRFARGGPPFSVETAVASWLEGHGYRGNAGSG